MCNEFFLRELAKGDVDVINRWRSDYELVDKLGANFRYIDKTIDEAWMAAYFNNRANNVRLAICQKGVESIVGVVYLISIDWVNRNCELAIMIGDQNCRGKGVGEFATRQALKHAFFDLNLHRVSLTVLESNVSAISLYSKLGFKREGLLKDVVYKSSKYHNMLSMALFKSEFSELNS
jgi:diamine N-acetyltransferase